MQQEQNKNKILKKMSKWTEEDKVAFAAVGMLCSSAKLYMDIKMPELNTENKYELNAENKYELNAENKYEYNKKARVADAAWSLLCMCMDAINYDKSYTIQDIIDDYYDSLKVKGYKNPFTDEY